MLIPTPKVWTTKPLRGTPFDWSHPANRGTLFCSPLNEFGGQPLDVISHAQAILAASTWDRLGIYTAASTDGAYWPTSIGQFGDTADFTVLLKMTPIAGTAANFYYLSNSRGTLSGTWRFMSTSGVQNILFGTYSGGTGTVTALYTLDGRSHTFVGRRTNSGQTVALFVDGKLFSSVTGIARNVDAATPTIHMGDPSTAGASTKPATREYVQVWGRALADGEIAAIGNNPWQLMAPATAFRVQTLMSQPPATIAIWCKVAGSLKQAQALWIKTGGNLQAVTGIHAKVSDNLKSVM